MDKLNQFISDLLDKKGIVVDDSDIRNSLILELRQRLDKMINREIFNSLPDVYLDEVEKLINEGRMDEVSAVIEKSGIDQAAIVAKTLTDFASRYLG